MDEDSIGLMFDTRIRVSSGEPSGVNLYAGSIDAFMPLIREDYAALAARNVMPGYTSEVVGQYSPSGDISRQMLVGVSAMYHEKTQVPKPMPFSRVGNNDFLAGAGSRRLKNANLTGTML